MCECQLPSEPRLLPTRLGGFRTELLLRSPRSATAPVVSLGYLWIGAPLLGNLASNDVMQQHGDALRTAIISRVWMCSSNPHLRPCVHTVPPSAPQLS